MRDNAKAGRVPVIHPFAIGAWPVLALWAGNPGEVAWPDALLCGSIVLAGVALLYVLSRFVLGGPYKAGLIVSLLVLMTFGYAGIYAFLASAAESLDLTLFQGPRSPFRHRYSLMLMGGILLLASLGILRTRRDLGRVTRIVNFIALTLLGIATAQVAYSSLTASTADSPGTEGEETVQIDPAGLPQPLPDIYFIVLDRYPSKSVLERAYAFDNSPFLEGLRGKGFQVLDESRSNYANTTLSLSSTLNMAYHPTEVVYDRVFQGLRKGHRVGRVLKQIGYQYVHIGSWYSPTRVCELADTNHRYPHGFSEFALALMGMTPISANIKQLTRRNHAAIALYQFNELASIIPPQVPTFVFAHILLPHPPIVFDRDGNPADDGAGRPEKERYVEQILFTNKQASELVDRILAESRTPPIIVVQADEGPYLRGDDLDLSLTEQERIRTGILSSMYLPPAMRLTLPSSSTPVNTFRVILKECFGADLPRLEDRVFGFTGLIHTDYRARRVRFEDISDQVR